MDKDKENKENEKELKAGRLSIDESNKMQELLKNGFSIEEIAKVLNRSPETIEKKKKELQNQLIGADVSEWIPRLRSRHYWDQIKRSLKDQSEIHYYEEEWASMMQMLSKQEILSSDEMMVRDLIMTDIMCFRMSASLAEFERKMDDLNKQIAIEEQKPPDQQDLPLMNMMRAQAVGFNNSMVQLSKMHTETQAKKKILHEQLKTTRDQRYREIKEANNDIFSVIMQLDNIKMRQKEGRMAELIRLSAQKTREKFSEYYEFSDGEFDKPLLNSDTVEDPYEKPREEQTQEEEPVEEQNVKGE
jgi:hypothetical protein